MANSNLVEKKIQFWKLPLTLSLLLSLLGCISEPESTNETENTPSDNIEQTETPDNSNNEVDIYDYVNQLRTSAGMIPLAKNQELEEAAQNHAVYVTANNMIGHNQLSTLINFTGKTPADRANYTGYSSRFIGEGVATEQSKTAAIDGLFSAIYHRFTLLSTEHNLIGIGFDLFDENEKHGALVHNMGNSQLNALCNNTSFSGTGTVYINQCLNRELKIPVNAFENAIADVKTQNPEVILWPPENASSPRTTRRCSSPARA